METTQGNNASGAQSNPQPATGTTGDEGSKERCGRYGKHRHRRGGVFVLMVALVAGMAGGYIGKSFAYGGPFAMGMHGDPAKMDEHVERAVKRFASKIDATPEQQQKLTAIARDAAKDVAPVREKLRDARKQATALVGAASVDRAAIERLRAEQIQLADTVSKRMTQALADAAEVLTPEQRQKVSERIGERHRRGWGWNRG